MTPAIVYRFRDAEGRLLYIGMTIVGPVRWGQHSVEQPWWPQVATVDVEHHPSAESALAAEAEAIRSEHPLYNRIHSHRATVRFPIKPRRPSGTGSVYQRGDGRWVAALGTGPRGARRIQRIYRWTRAEAEAALARLLGKS